LKYLPSEATLSSAANHLRLSSFFCLFVSLSVLFLLQSFQSASFFALYTFSLGSSFILMLSVLTSESISRLSPLFTLNPSPVSPNAYCSFSLNE
jgi:hypothetical protein